MSRVNYPVVPPLFFYFDLGNVLLHFDHARAARQLAALCGWEPARVYDFVFRADLNRRCDAGLVDAAEFCRTLRAATGTPATDAELIRAASDIFAPHEPMLRVVERLQADGRRLGLLSNTCDMHYEFFADGRFAPIPAAFEVIVLSYALKLQKPDAAIYAEATRRAGVAPHEIFFTDDLAANVAGARAFGWDAVLFTGPDDLGRALAERGVSLAG